MNTSEQRGGAVEPWWEQGEAAPQPRRRLIPRRALRQQPALVITVISLLVWEAWAGLRVFHHPWGDLKGGTYTDHFSHMNAARVFPLIGTDIWRRPYDKMFPRLPAETVARLPADVRAGGSYSGGIFAVPGWEAAKPLVSGWSANPRNYPPGDMLLVAPVAALYAHTPLAFATANRLLLMMLLLYAHVALLWMFQTALAQARADANAARALRWLRWVTVAVVYSEVIHWTLEGFYDGAALASLVLCARFVAQRRALPAIAAFCVASFIHFRSYFFAPWVLYAVWLAVRDRQWEDWRRAPLRSGGLMALSLVLGATSLGVFVLLWPALQQLPIHSHLRPQGGPRWLAAILFPSFSVVMTLAGVTLYRWRAWLDLAVLGWLAVMMLAIHEAYPWHTELALLPWLCAPPSVTEPPAALRIHAVRLAVLVASIPLVFGFEPFAVWKLSPF